MEHRRRGPAEYGASSRREAEDNLYGGQHYEYSGDPSYRRNAEREGIPPDYQRRRAENGGRRVAERPRSTGAEVRRRRPAEETRSAGSEVRRRRTVDEQRSARPVQGRERPSAPADRRRPAEGRTSASGTRKNGNTAKQPRKSVPLSERAKNAAKLRKAIRAENARLHRLRQQQKRKAKRRTVKRIDKGLFKRLIVMAGVIFAVILSMVIFFRVETVQVVGNSYYAEEEVLEACGVATGDNLLTLSRGKISGSIMAPLKYVESVKVSRQLPDTLIIRITESKPRYAVQDTEGNYYLMTAQGKIVEQITPSAAKEFTVVEELIICIPAMGEEVQIYAENGDETRARGQLTAMKALMVAIEEATLGRHVASVRIPSSFKVSLWYEDRFLVELGNTTRIDYKLEYLKAVVEREESYVTGTIDLTLKDGDKAIMLQGE